MQRQSTKKMVLAAVFAALCCVMTMSVRIPTPGTGGYIHPGDAMVVLCGIFLDPMTAFFAAGIGSCMADLLGGYFIYVPITFAIKGLIALWGSIVYRRLVSHGRSPYLAVVCCGLIDVALVAGGYCLCESFLYGPAAALASVPSNLTQGAGGLLIAWVLYPLLYRPVMRYS
ncbi:MAG: ECF transporter S component [Lachnospiraceae bacterium]|jgi:uncharacterized membrane protein|nr:ECF transporter S component [Lachnospiraceae bacterium]